MAVLRVAAVTTAALEAAWAELVALAVHREAVVWLVELSAAGRAAAMVAGRVVAMVALVVLRAAGRVAARAAGTVEAAAAGQWATARMESVVATEALEGHAVDMERREAQAAAVAVWVAAVAETVAAAAPAEGTAVVMVAGKVAVMETVAVLLAVALAEEKEPQARSQTW